MPFSLTLGSSYIGLMGIVFVVIFVRETLLKPGRNVNPYEVIRREHKESLREALKSRHLTLLTLFRDSIWASITFVVATLSGLLLYQLSSISGETTYVYVIFWRYQTLLLLTLLLYYLLGVFLGISLPILRAVREIESLIEKI